MTGAGLFFAAATRLAHADPACGRAVTCPHQEPMVDRCYHVQIAQPQPFHHARGLPAGELDRPGDERRIEAPSSSTPGQTSSVSRADKPANDRQVPQPWGTVLMQAAIGLTDTARLLPAQARLKSERSRRDDDDAEA
jgi:hypothetical protein